MNEHPEGTPNPLNPSPEPVNPAPVSPEPVQPSPAKPPVRPVSVAQPAPAVQPTPVSQPVDPMDRPMQQAPAPAPQPKKKTGIIAAVLVCLLIAVGCGVAAILLTLNKNADPVAAAMQKLMSNEAPKIVAAQGEINIKPSDDTALFSTLSIKFDTGISVSSNENYAKAVITAMLEDDEEFVINADEIRTADGDLYFKLSNIAETITNYITLINTTNCIDGEAGTNCVSPREVVDCDTEDDDCVDVDMVTPVDTDSISEFLGVFEIIDGEWIRIPSSMFSSIDDVVAVDENTKCVVDAAGKFGQYSNEIADLYHNNSFVTYSTDNLTVVKKKDPLYRLGLDDEKLAGFVNSVSDSKFMNELLACADEQTTIKEVTADDISQITAMLPVLYVEIDDNHNFTRVYIDRTNIDDVAEVTVDISLSYPTGINVQAPDEYTEINDLLSQLLMDSYGGNVGGLIEQ